MHVAAVVVLFFGNCEKMLFHSPLEVSGNANRKFCLNGKTALNLGDKGLVKCVSLSFTRKLCSKSEVN